MPFTCGGICTVEADLAKELCYGREIKDVGYSPLQKMLVEFAKVYIREQEQWGYEYIEKDLLHVYGPYWASERLAHITNPELMRLMHSELRPQLTMSNEPGRNAYAQYIIVGNFKAATRSARQLLSSALRKESGLIGVR